MFLENVSVTNWLKVYILLILRCLKVYKFQKVVWFRQTTYCKKIEYVDKRIPDTNIFVEAKDFKRLKKVNFNARREVTSKKIVAEAEKKWKMPHVWFKNFCWQKIF